MADPTTGVGQLTSFWQNDLIGLRADRFINWKRVRQAGVQFTTATYTA
jgi:hypothetical protein